MTAVVPYNEITMSEATVTVDGVVTPDGRLEVPQKLDLPAGRVQVTVQRLPEAAQPERFWKMMDSIWADLRDRAPRTRKEIDAEIEAVRTEAEEEVQAVERLQEECRRAAEQAKGTNGPAR